MAIRIMILSQKVIFHKDNQIGTREGMEIPKTSILLPGNHPTSHNVWIRPRWRFFVFPKTKIQDDSVLNV